MGVSVTVESEKHTGPKYPCLMQSTHSDLIVLAYEENGSTKFKGTVISKGYGTFDIGYTSCVWEKSVFVPFKGTVTLKGE